MKKKMLIVSAIAAFSFNSVGQLNLGLVAQYDFSGDVLDASGNNLHGTVNGATLVADRNGNPSSAYSFDGIDDYILIGDPIPSALQIQNEITLSAWIHVTDYPQNSYDMGLIVGSQCDFGCTFAGISMFLDGRIDPDGLTAPEGHIHFNFGDGTSWHPSNSNSQVPLNEWVHIVATRAANEDAKIYYNGIPQPVNGMTWDGSVSYIGTEFAIGREKNIDRFFNGYIDDVRVYDRELTDLEVSELYSVSVGIDKLSQSKKELVKVLDLMGRETKPQKNKIFIYVYSDGTNQLIFEFE
jgi:hypothetical protein